MKHMKASSVSALIAALCVVLMLVLPPRTPLVAGRILLIINLLAYLNAMILFFIEKEGFKPIDIATVSILFAETVVILIVIGLLVSFSQSENWSYS